MNGIHDMGGMHGFGPVDANDTEPYHHEWEKQVLAITLAMGATGTWNLDQSRSARESLPPAFYLSAGYYGIWLQALQNLLIQYQLVTQQELDSGSAMCSAKYSGKILSAENVQVALRAGSPVTREHTTQPVFAVGDFVTVRNLQPSEHTRLPAYIRNKTGVVHRLHACHVFADAHARGDGEKPQWLYNVRFEAAHLWEDVHQSSVNTDASTSADAVHVDCWESYLQEAIL